MSELDKALEQFGFLTIDDINIQSLRRAFKHKVFESHPDKGGDANEFDTMLQSFTYLSDTFQRINGGRKILESILSPDELKEKQNLSDVIINRVFQEFSNEEFNKEFEKNHKPTGHGYGDWLKTKSDESNLLYGKYGEATLKEPTFVHTDFNKVFEESSKKGKPEPTSVILHPDAMAYTSGSNLGSEIIENHTGGYTSDLFQNPEYTDLYSAFTTDNTICDKVTSFTDKSKSLDDLVMSITNERNTVIAPLDNKELEAIQAFEKNKLEKNKQHLQNIKKHYEWSDEHAARYISNLPSVLYPNHDDGFVHTL